MTSETPTSDGAAIRNGSAVRHVPVNGTHSEPASIPAGAPAPAPSPSGPAGALDAVTWHLAYDRESVERYLAALDRERTRLEDEISEAEQRIASADAARTRRTAEQEAGLGAVVSAARAELDRIERERADAVEAIRAEATAEVARIQEAARVEVEAVRAAASSLRDLRPRAVSDPAAALDRDDAPRSSDSFGPDGGSHAG